MSTSRVFTYISQFYQRSNNYITSKSLNLHTLTTFLVSAIEAHKTKEVEAAARADDDDAEDVKAVARTDEDDAAEPEDELTNLLPEWMMMVLLYQVLLQKCVHSALKILLISEVLALYMLDTEL